MNDDLNIREHNNQAHIDIEEEIGRLKNGLLTFILRVNNGNIVDLVVMEYADSRKYLILTKVIKAEFTITRSGGERSPGDPIRTDNI